MPQLDADALYGIVVGIGLAAACGFRVFIPLLVAGIAVAANKWQVTPSMEWIGSWPALLAFGTATGLEIASYYVPWLDNALDTVATPAAIVAGTLTSAAFITGMDPMSQWALALIAGGGTAGTVQVMSVGVRAVSTATTGGLGNPVVSTVEAGAATALSIVAIVAPILAGLFVLVLFVMLFRWIARRRATKRLRQQTAYVAAV